MSHSADSEVNDLYACQRLIKELRQDLDRISAERDAYREALKVAARTGYATVNLVNRLDTPRLPRAEFRRIVANIKANLQVLQRDPEARRILAENDR